ncbi:MAG: flagellar biosynthesis protein FlhF, partial [Calditrichia bacterium]
SSFQDAFDQVKEELGADAVILNSRKIKDGGVLDFLKTREMYEITAAADEQGAYKRPSSPVKRKAPNAYQENPQPARPAQQQQEESKAAGNGDDRFVQDNLIRQTDEIRSMQDELKDMKKVLGEVSEFLKYSRMPALPSIFKSLLKTMIDNEVNEDMAKAVIQTVYARTAAADYENSARVTEQLSALLQRMIRIAPPLDKGKGRPYIAALVGPTGVGKTTTIAKLAANLKLYGNKKVALISADTYRIAAIEQLQTFANIASLPMSVAYSPEEISEAVQRFRDRDVILIDTVGRSQKDQDQLQNLKSFLEKAGAQEVHLVLSLTTGYNNLIDIVRRFKMLQPNRLIFTKLDEANYAGNILNIIYKHQLPVSYLTSGQVVPNDIEPAESQALAKLIYKGV